MPTELEQRARELLAAEYSDDPTMAALIRRGEFRSEQSRRGVLAIAAALRESEEWRRDAERYRWLRDLPLGSPHEDIGNMPGDMWDAAIDAARKEGV